uniref:Uncharacterized protein n=1 Tax=Leptobrachium leishanense TaxID=445787 RepID=A0A8C5R8J4_9ANUR
PSVRLSIVHMVLYLSFPVTMFWISNQADYFEEYVVKRKVSILASVVKHGLRLEGQRFKSNIRKHYFIERVVDT